MEDVTLVVEALNCAILTRLNPERFPDFASISNSFENGMLDESNLDVMRDYYHRILNKL